MIDFDKLLKVVVEQGASDLFITAGLPPSMKVSGKMMPMSKTPLMPDQAREIVHGAMNEAQVKEFETERECNFAPQTSGGRSVAVHFISATLPVWCCGVLKLTFHRSMTSSSRKS